MTPRQRRLDRLVASVVGTPAVAPAKAARLPRLTSKRIRQVQTLAPCAVCAGSSRRMWACQAEASTVLLCEACKLAAFDASFGTIDAAHLAEPTAVESNRRRH